MYNESVLSTKNNIINVCNKSTMPNVGIYLKSLLHGLMIELYI